MSREPFKISFKDSEPESQIDGQAERRVGFTEDHATSQNLHVLNHGLLRPGLRLPWFYHEDKDEVIVVLEGSGVMHIDGGDPIELAAGDVLNVPAKTRHSLENNSSADLKAIFFKVFI